MLAMWHPSMDITSHGRDAAGTIQAVLITWWLGSNTTNFY
jgi:hypothetical protein